MTRAPACNAGGLAGHDVPIPAADPVGDQPTVLGNLSRPLMLTRGS
jgi:hypothetical protein